MKSDTLRVSTITVVVIGVVGLLGVAGHTAWTAGDLQEAAEKEQCKQMCTSGISSCKETTDYQSLVVKCNTDAGYVLMVTDIVKVK